MGSRDGRNVGLGHPDDHLDCGHAIEDLPRSAAQPDIHIQSNKVMQIRLAVRDTYADS